MPVRLGGPWAGSGTGGWELWRAGRYQDTANAEYRVRKGNLECRQYTGEYRVSFNNHDLHELELRTPEGWHGKAPEGTYILQPEERTCEENAWKSAFTWMKSKIASAKVK